MNLTAAKPYIFGGVGLLVGGFVGFVVTQRVLSVKYEERMQEEIASVKEHYRLLRKDGIEPGDLRKMRITDEYAQDLIDQGKAVQLMDSLGYAGEEVESQATDEMEEELHPDPLEVRPDEESRKMTIEEEQVIDPQDERLREMIAMRSPKDPYVITIDEFMDDHEDYDKISLTYFEGDDTLTDDQEKPIPDIEAQVGHDALTNFGLFSKDKNIVYVRNDRTATDFEIARDGRSFIEAVAGFKEPKVQRKMREDD